MHYLYMHAIDCRPSHAAIFVQLCGFGNNCWLVEYVICQLLGKLYLGKQRVALP